MSTPPPGSDPMLPARLRALAIITEGERRTGRAWWQSMTRFLDRVRPAVMRDGGIDPGRVSDHQQFWTDEVNVRILPTVAQTLRNAFRRVAGAPDPPGDPWVAQYLNEAGNRLVRIPDEVYALIVTEVERGIQNGDDIPTVSAAVDTILTITGSERWRNRARTVARTETMGAVNGGAFRGATLDAEERGDPAPFKVWLSTDDRRTRPTHVAADGQRTLLAEPFVVGGAALLYPGDPMGPANEVINCHPGDTRVSLTSELQRVYRRSYEGPLIRIKTLDGMELSATPNHPLLTDTGWVPAQGLQVGDHLVGAPGAERVGGREPHVQNAETTLQELYASALESGVPLRTVGSAVDFHGDGSDKEVQVVPVHGGLRDVSDPARVQGGRDQEFVRLSHGEEPLALRRCGQGRPMPGSTCEPGRRALPDCGVGRCCESLATLEGGARHPVVHGLATATDGQPKLPEPTNNDRSADPEMVRETLDRLTGRVALREVAEVDVYTFHGSVFNLETADGWYIANGIASHNCRCTQLPIVLGETIDWTNRQFREDA